MRLWTLCCKTQLLASSHGAVVEASKPLAANSFHSAQGQTPDFYANNYQVDWWTVVSLPGKIELMQSQHNWAVMTSVTLSRNVTCHADVTESVTAREIYQ